MMFKLLVASFCVLNFINFINCQSELETNLKTVDRFSEIITKTTEIVKNSLDNDYFDQAKIVAKEFYQQIENFSKMFKLVMLWVNAFDATRLETPTAKLKKYIKEQFAIVNGKLELIENKLDQINVVIQDELVKSKLRDYLQMRDRIREMLNSFNANPNNITTIQLKEICATNPMRSFLVFLNGQVLDGGEGSLLEAMKRGHFKRTFMEWSKNIYSMFVEANVLYTQCFTVTYFKSHSEEEFTTTLNADNAKFEEMLEKITAKLEHEHNEFLKPENYMKWVESDLRENMQRHRGMSHGEFATRMRDLIGNKYYWRLWLVMSYDGDTAYLSQRVHTTSEHTVAVYGDQNRCVLLSSMKRYTNEANPIEERQNWGNQVRNYVLWHGPHAFISNEKCLNIWEIIRRKFPDAKIHCVNSDKHMQFAASPEALYASFSVTTFKADGQTRTFPNQAECDKWVHYNYRGTYPGLFTIPQACIGYSMNVIVTNFLDD